MVWVCGCNYIWEHGIRIKCTIQLLPKSIVIACRVMLNAYPGCNHQTVNVACIGQCSYAGSIIHYQKCVANGCSLWMVYCLSYCTRLKSCMPAGNPQFYGQWTVEDIRIVLCGHWKLVITQVSNCLKKSHIFICSKYKYLQASLANVKPCVTIVPIH